MPKNEPKSKVLKKEGYSLHFVNPNDKALLNNLRNTDRVFGEITVTPAGDDKITEVILAVKD